MLLEESCERLPIIVLKAIPLSWSMVREYLCAEFCRDPLSYGDGRK
jgi:hypothetical protein